MVMLDPKRERLTDAQIATLFFIAEKKPPMPRDMDRFPNVRKFLADGLIKRENDRLVIAGFEYDDYRDVAPATIEEKRHAHVNSFDEMETAGMLNFNHPIDGEGQTFFIEDMRELREKLYYQCDSMLEVTAERFSYTTPKKPKDVEKAAKLIADFMRSHPSYFGG
jgi:hypothetical protein